MNGDLEIGKIIEAEYLQSAIELLVFFRQNSNI